MTTGGRASSFGARSANILARGSKRVEADDLLEDVLAIGAPKALVFDWEEEEAGTAEPKADPKAEPPNALPPPNADPVFPGALT